MLKTHDSPMNDMYFKIHLELIDLYLNTGEKFQILAQKLMCSETGVGALEYFGKIHYKMIVDDYIIVLYW